MSTDKRQQPKGRWVGVKDVRKHNGHNFVDDFRNARRCAVMSDETGRSFEVKKIDVWYVAQRAKIYYRMSEHGSMFIL